MVLTLIYNALIGSIYRNRPNNEVNQTNNENIVNNNEKHLSDENSHQLNLSNDNQDFFNYNDEENHESSQNIDNSNTRDNYGTPILSLELKKTIAFEINSGLKISKEIASEYQIKASRINCIARKVRLGKNISLQSGRPAVIDSCSDRILKDLIISLRNNSQDIKERIKILRSTIKQEFIFSYMRRNNINESTNLPLKLKFSSRTLNRYLVKYKM